jgi:GxxExxY protein
MVELLLKDEVYAIVGAAMEVYNQLGPGFLEPIYQEAMEIETLERQIPIKPRHELVVLYKGKHLKKFYIADLICFDQVIVEIKAIDTLTTREESQLINYLKATGLKVGLLINFGSHGKLEW